MLLPQSLWCLLLLVLLSCTVINVLVDGQLMEEGHLKEYRASGERSNFVVWHKWNAFRIRVIDTMHG